MGPAKSSQKGMGGLLCKMVFFSLMIIGLPTATFFLSYHHHMDGFWKSLGLRLTSSNRATFSGAAAVLVANVCVICYVLMAVFEDTGYKAKSD
ncbi:unnamed protein product [Pedinophyceae sp. YPF-701]|nr:unnamed protein product [Pedinophyceae sp. YPF-701]